MPYIFTLDQLPVGYSLSTGKGGGSIKVTYNEFISSEDGDLFISRLEGWPNLLLEQASVAIRPSHVDHMLAIISKDKHVTVYINELPIVMQIVAKGTLKAGQGVTANHIADIKSVEFNGVKIPNDCGILFLFSQGWRKGLFYDFGPLQHEPTNIDYDVNKVFGQLFSYLLFQDVFKISELEWERMVNQQWFPFITLRREVVTEVINYARNEWNIDELLPKIKHNVDDRLPEIQNSLKQRPAFKEHVVFFEKSIEHYRNDDYLSATSILFPRIEGALRSFHYSLNITKKASQTTLAKSAVDNLSDDYSHHSLLLPVRFREYLQKVFFANFDEHGHIPLSRNSVAHGVVKESDCNLKSILIGFLVLDQLSFYFNATENSANKANPADEKG